MKTEANLQNISKKTKINYLQELFENKIARISELSPRRSHNKIEDVHQNHGITAH